MSDNPIKDALFAVLQSDRFMDMARDGMYDTIVQEAIAESLERTRHMAPYAILLETLATGILHYILTISGTPSQRKVEYNGIHVDIVVPGIKKLHLNPASALIVQIGCNCQEITSRRFHTMQIQPIHSNTFYLTQECNIPRRYTIYGKDATFPDMINDIIQFAADHQHNRLGIIP